MDRSRRLWSRFVTVTRPFFVLDARRQALGLLGLLVFLLVVVSGLNVVHNYIGRDFMTALEHRSGSRFLSLAALYMAAFLVSTVVATLARYIEELLGLRWREWLTRYLTDRYLAGHAYYRIKSSGSVDNPDQRIAEDVKTFTTNTLAIGLILLNSTIALCTFAGVLWSITPWLLLAAVVYAIFGSGMTILLGRRLVGLDVLQLKKEADLRYDLIRVREYAEPIALLQGETQENGRVRRRLAALVDNYRRIIRLNCNLNFFGNGYRYMIQLIPVVIVAPLYFRSEVEFGVITQAAGAFAFVINAFSVIVTEFQRITQFAADLERLTTIWEATEVDPLDKHALETQETETCLAFENFTLVTPEEGRLLIEDLSLEVPCGSHLLIRGPDGAGRTSLLRSMAGLWHHGQGRILRPPLDQLLFLPERPYLPVGTLRDQLVYAAQGREIADEEILDVIRDVGLAGVAERVGGLDAERDWPNVLSLGEQQALAFGRLLLARPQFAFLDEVTTALDADRVRHLYGLLGRTSTTCVTVGNDPVLLELHDRSLELDGNGAWRLEEETADLQVA